MPKTIERTLVVVLILAMLGAAVAMVWIKASEPGAVHGVHGVHGAPMRLVPLRPGR